MLMDAAQLQKLIDWTYQKQTQADQVARYRNAGDHEAAAFLDLPADQRATLLARQDIVDANSSARQGDRAGTEAALTSAINRQMNGTRLAPRRKRVR